MKSREGQYPAPEALSELLYHWLKTWPNAQLDRAAVARLYPYIVEKWREGWSIPQIAQTACSCNDGMNITPSPAAVQRLPARRMSLPPVEAKPGAPFGGEEIRDVDSVAKLKMKAEVADLESQSLDSQLKIAYRKLAVASPASKERLEQQIRQLIAKQAAQATVKQDAQKRLADMEAGRRPPKTERKAKAAAPVASAAPPEKKTRAPRTAKPKAVPSAPPAPPAPPVAGPRTDEAIEDELSAMFEKDGQ